MDEAILGAYLAGANTQRIRKALSPLLGKAHLSKSTISRVVGRLKAYFERWRQRDLSGERYWILYLDGFHLKVRPGAACRCRYWRCSGSSLTARRCW